MKALEYLLTRESCEVERTQEELHAWVHQVLSAGAASAESRNRFRLRQDFLAKRFMEEIWPLSLVADHCYEGRKDVAFRLVFDVGPFDAQILDRSSSMPEAIPLEFTQAHYDEETYHRLLLLASQGHVPWTGPVTKTGTRATGISVNAVLEFVDSSQDRAAQFAKIEEAVRRKAKVARPFGARLAVVYEGLHIARQQDFQQLREFALHRLVPLLGPFAHLYVVRSEGDHVLEITAARDS